jgi:phage terminase large subunit
VGWSEIRVLDYYEAVGQVLASTSHGCATKGYEKAIIHLPHDGVNENIITGKRLRTISGGWV